MRAAILSDTHGNAFALEAVLKELKQAAPDVIFNLGDQIEGVADPAHAAGLQAALQAEWGAVEVRGNNEEKWWPGGRRNPLSQELGAWLETQVSAATLERLAALPLTARAGGILACHGTPGSAWTSLLWEWDNAGQCYRSRDPRELRKIVEPLGAEVVLCGHTHRPGATRVGDTLVVNCGSVSDQVDGDPRARWTLLERGKSGGWSVDFRAVAYDVAAAVRWASEHSPFGEYAAAALQSGEMTARGG